MKTKHNRSGSLLILAATVFALLLTACGSDRAADPNYGMWEGAAASMSGFELEITELYEGGVQLELKPKGKAVLYAAGENYGCKWSYEDGVLTVSNRSIAMTGTIKDGVLTLQNLMGSGVDLTFTK